VEPSQMRELFDTIDRKDADGFAAFLTEDAVFKMGNGHPVTGKAAIREMVKGFFVGLKGLRHEVTEEWTFGSAALCHGTVTYTRQDGSELRVPFANVLKLQDSLIREYLVFIDVSEL
jgi:ketosteroid isomerase-like protein